MPLFADSVIKQFEWENITLHYTLHYTVHCIIHYITLYRTLHYTLHYIIPYITLYRTLHHTLHCIIHYTRTLYISLYIILRKEKMGSMNVKNVPMYQL